MSVQGKKKGDQDDEQMEILNDAKEKRLTKTQSTFLKLFDCPVCFERICPPVTVCINGHAVCKDCKQHLLTCPTCKAPFSHYKNTMIDQIIEENVFLCKYSDKGCIVELKFHAMEDHEKKQCRHRMLKCELLKTNCEVVCEEEIPILDYYFHVLRNHRQEVINFRVETFRTLNITENLSKTCILKNTNTQKILLETVKLDLEAKKFYIVYQFVGLHDDSVVTLRLYNPNLRYKELVYRNVCVAVGMAQQDLEDSDKCLVLHSTVLNNFAVDGVLSYSIKIDTIPKKWLQTLKDKIANVTFRGLHNSGVASSSS